MDVQNYVPRLNEFAQRSRLNLKYEDVGRDGPDHCRTFRIRAVINDTDYPVGVGRNKKEAKQNAAKNALDAILAESVPQSDSTDVTRPAECPSPRPTPGPMTQANYMCWLNEYCHKLRVICKAIESTKMGPGFSTLGCRYVVGDKEFPEAFGTTKKEAKEQAAKAVYEELMRVSNKEPVDESQTGDSTEHEESLSQSVSACLRSLNKSPAAEASAMELEKNYIGTLNDYCQKTKRVCDYKLVGKKGPSHQPIFVYRVVIDKKEYPEFQGGTAKEAKQGAAQLAWDALKEQPDWDSQVSCRLTEDSAPSSSVCDSEDVATPNNKAESSSGGVIFQNSSSVKNSKMACGPDVRPKVKMAPSFFNAPNKENRVKNNNLRKLPEKTTQSTESLFLKDYDKIERIGKGGFGRVFKARKKIENKDVAVKIVKWTTKALREVTALSDLQHPNIVRYYHAWTEDTGFQSEDVDSSSSTSDSGPPEKYIYIQMELCKGGTLRDWISNRNKQPNQDTRNKEALNILKQVVNGVKYIHSKKLIHRDLKPTNIMFTSDKTVKIGDFGLVTVAESESDEALLERTKKKGTKVYMSPEQMNQSQYDKEVDIFALGLVFFEVLWKMTTECEKSKIWKDARKRTFPAEFYMNYRTESQLIERMLSEKPEDRPDATEIASELQKYSANLKEHQNSLQEMKTI